MGKPTGASQYSVTESIGRGRRTRGTETSKYLQEKKSTEIPSHDTKGIADENE